MQNDTRPIGVMDAGLGGFTVVKELQRILPREPIVFYGDGKNQPYGNRSEEEIVYLARQCLDFLKEQQVKAVAIACNTISTVIDQLRDGYPFPIFSIVQAGSDDVIRMKLREVGLLATVFTAQSGCYERLIRQADPAVEVYPQGCPMLARIIEDGTFDQARLHTELEQTLGALAAAHPGLSALILGCTHYPLVKDMIQERYPQFTTLINPAATQAEQVRDYLTQKQELDEGGDGSFRIYTTSDCQVYRNMARIAGLREPASIELVPAPKLLYPV